MIDMTDKYNTKLSSKEQAEFKSWMDQQSKIVGRDLSKDISNYDLQGFWKAHPNFSYADPSQHLNDTYKKPNHPTFSNESIYNGIDGYKGGSWKQMGQGWQFVASNTNVKMMGTKNLEDYFKKVEPDSKLVLPGPSAAQVLYPNQGGATS